MLSRLASTGRLSRGSFWRISREGRLEVEGVLLSERRPEVKRGEYWANMARAGTEAAGRHNRQAGGAERAGVGSPTSSQASRTAGRGRGSGEVEAIVLWRRARVLGGCSLRGIIATRGCLAAAQIGIGSPWRPSVNLPSHPVTGHPSHRGRMGRAQRRDVRRRLRPATHADLPGCFPQRLLRVLRCPGCFFAAASHVYCEQ